MSGHLEKEALKLGAIRVAEIEKKDVEGGVISRDWEITFELDGFTIKHGVSCSLEDMYNWVLQLAGVFNISANKATVKSVAPAPTHSNIDGANVEQPNFNLTATKYPDRKDANKIVDGLLCPFNEGKELAPSREDWARYNQQDGMLDNYFCTKEQDASGEWITPANCTRGADCGKTIWRREAHTSFTV